METIVFLIEVVNVIWPKRKLTSLCQTNTNMPLPQFFQQQQWSNSCGLHAINNALEEQIYLFERTKSLASNMDKNNPGQTNYDHNGFSISVLLKTLYDAGHTTDILSDVDQMEQYNSVICWTKDGPGQYFAMIGGGGRLQSGEHEYVPPPILWRTKMVEFMRGTCIE